ncbi:NAD-dependent epimerase/dehydratase family protein [uncultured Thalassospira sp.]|uniref:NAD-dependent epimerase/dehydratase family protein n=1 Tax=uncultured Thalassospira sp. TaxID=404382 RepID=UPI0030D7E757|tara:strand:+ start:1208 stop:2191 length:984 start_codon:yes stop_codon:yes gene_type:complete
MSDQKRMAITGANGFVGQAVCKAALAAGYAVRPLVRSETAKAQLPADLAQYARVVGDIDGDTDWADHLQDVNCVVHLAARVHVMRDISTDPLAAFRAVNVAGSLHLARAADAQNVKRMVFVSSVKVNGEETRFSAFNEHSPVKPKDPYGQSKAEAENALRQFSQISGLGLTILRPPLVYGPGVKANFAAMAKLTRRGIPLPFGAIRNHRSLIHVDNLADACVVAVGHPTACYKTYLVSDGEDFSIGEMMTLLAEGMGKKPVMVPVPTCILGFLGQITGKSAEVQRLTSSLQIDNRAIRRDLNWLPPIEARDGLRSVGAWFAQPGKVD